MCTETFQAHSSVRSPFPRTSLSEHHEVQPHEHNSPDIHKGIRRGGEEGKGDDEFHSNIRKLFDVWRNSMTVSKDDVGLACCVRLKVDLKMIVRVGWLLLSVVGDGGGVGTIQS